MIAIIIRSYRRALTHIVSPVMNWLLNRVFANFQYISDIYLICSNKMNLV